MKVCPKCGYVDTSDWRQNRWRTNVEFLPLSKFREEHLEISRSLEEGHGVQTDELYAYRLSGFYVERIWVETYRIGGKKAFHIPREHFEHKRDPYQRKLTSNTM